MNSRFDNRYSRHKGPGQRRIRDSFKSPKDNVKYGVINRVRSQAGVRSQIVLIYNPKAYQSLSILTSAIQRIKGQLRIQNEGQDPNNEGHSMFSLYINDERICQGSNIQESIAKKDLYDLAVESLKTTCFTVIRKTPLRDSPRVDLDSSSSENSVLETQSAAVSGIGAKMMMKMGWSGGGLGSQAQGMTDIVQPTYQIERQGFGTKVTIPIDKVREILQTYVESDNINSISFSPDFTKEERSVIHSVAQKMNLKSTSYGKGADRCLVIQKKIDPWQLVYKLFEVGGENEQYQLVTPTKFLNR